jgi:hypothetical protein
MMDDHIQNLDVLANGMTDYSIRIPASGWSCIDMHRIRFSLWFQIGCSNIQLMSFPIPYRAYICRGSILRWFYLNLHNSYRHSYTSRGAKYHNLFLGTQQSPPSIATRSASSFSTEHA